MLKQFRALLMGVAILAIAASCQTANKDVKEQARESISTAEQPMPADPNAATVQPAMPTGPTTTMEFKEMDFDFGTVQDGEKVSHTYKFTNTGKEPLIISDAKGSCGCTVPSWPKEPIAPGKSGDIVVEFNTQGKSGNRNQKVTLTANTNPPQTFLSLKGVVTGGTDATTTQPQVKQ